MDTTAAVWLLDVDGVIRAKSPRWTKDPVVLDIHGLRTRFAPELRSWLRDLAEIIDIRWATSWCGHPDELRELAAELDLDLPLSFGDRRASEVWGDLKVEAVISELRAGRRVIWTDDEEVPAGLRLFPELRKAQDEGRLLAIAPDSIRGLRPEHMTTIEAFGLAALRVPQAA